MRKLAIALAMFLGLVNMFIALNTPVSYAQEAPEPEKPEKPQTPGD